MVQIVLWNTDTDEFIQGQWLKGTIYERRGDLSPDGKYMIYFAANRRTKVHQEGTWTAISRPPYLTALALWWKGDSYGGGGLFLDKRTVGLNDAYENDHRPSSKFPKPPIKVDLLHLGSGEDWPVERARLERDGWRTVQEMKYRERPRVLLPAEFEPGSPEAIQWVTDRYAEIDLIDRGNWTQEPYIREKSRDGISLICTESIKAYRNVELFHLRAEDGRERRLGKITWADWDRRGRIVYTANGGVYALSPKDALDTENKGACLADFTGTTFSPMKAPDWATRW